mgnify:CR=1 FL=1
MHTIFWGSMVGICGIAQIISFYFHLSHDDLKMGRAKIFDLTESMRRYYPLEAMLQIISCIGLFIYNDYVAFAFSLPMLLFNLKMLLYKEFNCHAVVEQEYTKRAYMERISYLKTLFNTTILVYVVVRFIRSFSKAVQYRLFG